MKIKKVLSMFLAVAMMMSLAISASAADTTLTTDGSETDVKLNGTVSENAVIISVVMPTSIDFTVATVSSSATVANIGTNVSAQSAGYEFSALVSGTGEVTNKSTVDIKLDITGVTDPNGLLDKMILGVKTGSMTEKAALADALSTAVSGDSPIALASAIANSGGTETLEVVGQGGTGTYSGIEYPVNLVAGNYTVTTTMKVSVA